MIYPWNDGYKSYNGDLKNSCVINYQRRMSMAGSSECHRAAVPRVEDSLNPKEFKVTASCQEGRWTKSFQDQRLSEAFGIIIFLNPHFSDKSLVVVELNYLKLSNTKITGSTELTVQVRSSARWGLGWSPGGTAEFSHRMNGLNGCRGQAVQELDRSVCPPEKGEHDEWYYMVSPRTTRISPPFLV